VLQDTDSFVQSLNDQFTNPSGKGLSDVQRQPTPEPAPKEEGSGPAAG
jgi:hypothetical protein